MRDGGVIKNEEDRDVVVTVISQFCPIIILVSEESQECTC
jgi:hypothetical protein